MIIILSHEINLFYIKEFPSFVHLQQGAAFRGGGESLLLPLFTLT